VRREHSSASGKLARPTAKAGSHAADQLDELSGQALELPDTGPQAEAALAQSEEWADALIGGGGDDAGADEPNPAGAAAQAGGAPDMLQVPASDGPRGDTEGAPSVSAGSAGPAVASAPNLASEPKGPEAGDDAPPGEDTPPDETEGAEAEAEGEEEATAEGEEAAAEGEGQAVPGALAPAGPGGAPIAAEGAPLAGGQSAAEGAPGGGEQLPPEALPGAAPVPTDAAPGPAQSGGEKPAAAPAVKDAGGDIGQKVVLAVVRPEAVGDVQPIDQLAPMADGSVPVRLNSPSEVEAARVRTGNAVGLVEPQGMQAVAARRRADAGTALEQFKAQAETRKQALDALKQKIDPAVEQARQEAQAQLEQTLAQQKSAIGQAIAQARAAAEQEAASARSAIEQSHAQVTTQIKADAAGARQGIEQAHRTESGNVAKLKGEIGGKVAEAFSKAADEARAAGKAAGDQAVAIASRRAQAYQAAEIPKQGRLSSFFEGEDYEKNKHDAKVQAANDVGKAYQAEFAKKAEETATAMPQGQAQVVDGLTQRADAAAQAVDAAKTGALKQIDAREQGDLANADRVRDQKLAAVDGALAGANNAFAGLEQSKSAELDEKAAGQSAEIEQQSQARRDGLVQMLDQAAEQLQSKIDETVAQAEAVELPDNDRLQQSLDSALAKLDEVVQQADQGISQGADELRTSLGQSNQQFQQAGDQTVQTAQQEAQAAGQQAAQTAQGEAQGAQQALQAVGQGAAEGMGQAKTDACKDITDASAKLDADFTKVTGNLGGTLSKSTQDLNKDFQGSLSGIDAEVTKKANEAAGKVQPSWKKWVAIVLTIIISIIVTAAIAALAASGIGLIALIGLSLLIGAAGGVAKMCVEKWASGEEITWKDVGKAAAIGAVEGLINLVGAGAGSAVAGKLTTMIGKKFGEEVLKKFAVKAAVFMAETVVGTVIDTIGSGITDTIGRMWDGKEVSLKTFWDAMTGNVVSNFIGNFGGGLLAPYFGKVLSKLGIGKAAAKEAGEQTTKEATEKATKEAIEQADKSVTKEIAEQTIKAETEAATKEAAERVAKDAAEKTTKEAAEATIRAEAERVAKEAAEKAAKETKLLPAPKEQPKLLGPGKVEEPKLLPAPKEQPKLLGPGKVEEPKLLPAPKEQPKLLGPGKVEEPKLLPAPKDEPKLLGPGKVEEPKLLPAPKEQPKLLGPGKVEEPKLLPAPRSSPSCSVPARSRSPNSCPPRRSSPSCSVPARSRSPNSCPPPRSSPSCSARQGRGAQAARPRQGRGAQTPARPKDEPKLLGPGKTDEPKLLGPGKVEEPKLLPAPKEQPKLEAGAKTDADAKLETKTEAGAKTDVDAGVKTDLHTKVDETVGPMKGNLKESPLRAEYEGKVADLKKVADDMVAAGKSPEEIARALHQARRNLGVEFKDLTPGPLRKYIYEVNLQRYGDELGPSFEFLVKKYEKDLLEGTIKDRKAIFDKIIGASSRPNENVDKLLQNFGDWLKKQDPAYIEKALLELKAPRPSGGGGGANVNTHTTPDAKVDTNTGPKTDGPKTDGPQTEGPQTNGPKTDAPKTDAPKTDAAATPKGAQHTGDVEQLYKDAAVAQKELSDATLDIAGKTGGKPIIPEKLKGRERAMEKVNVEYKGDASRLTDLARSSVEYKKLEDVYKGLEILKSKYEIVQIKDRFAKPTSAGYRDILLTVRMSNGHVCEVQLHLEQILAVKGGEGHHLYEIIRSIEATAAKEARALTKAELAKIEWANGESRRLYNEAIEKAMGGN
jgi:hypothetical protein